jgi:hypothetical protein
MIRINNITKEQFDKLENAQKLIWEHIDDSIRYAQILGENIHYGLAWYHDVSNFHFYLEIPTFDLFVIATWDKVFGISMKQGNIVFLENLLFTLVGIVEIDQGFLIITEVDIRVVDGERLLVGSSFLPGEAAVIFDYELLGDNMIKLVCDEGDKVVKYWPG